MTLPKVSIVTVNYKQSRVTCELLASINQLSYPNLETILIDNDQPYDDSALFKMQLEDVIVINAQSNTGYAGGNNLGIKYATGDYILLLNNDTEIEDGVIETLLEVFNSQDNVGAVSPIIKYFDVPDKIQFAGFTEIDQITGRNKLIKNKPSSKTTNTPYFHGAAVMIPSVVIDDCGMMPEEYFLYYEELAWSQIMTNKGYEIKVATEIEVLHKESVTTGRNSPLKTYYQNRNRVHFMRNGLKDHYQFILFYVLVSLPKNLLQHTLRREWNHLKALLKAASHSLINPKYGEQSFL